jgi:putative RecB family exonuclease
MSVYSFSQTQTFVQCPRKYQYKYVDKIKEKEFESSPDLILGHSVHAALEWLYNQINIFKIPNKDELLTKFKDQRDTEIAEASKEKPLQIKGEQTLEDYIRRGIHYLANYYDKYSPFAWITVVATEASIVFDLHPAINPPSFLPLEKETSSSIKFRGFIDRLDKEGETFVINDYKTNKNLPPESKEEYQEQLTLYALWVQQNYAKYFKHLKARLHYLHFDLMDEREITNERLATITKKYWDIINDIEDKKFHYNMGDTKVFEPKENNFCRYCEYFSLCPLRAHLKFDDEVVGGELGEKTVKGLVDEYVSLSKQESQAKNDKELIKILLIEYLEKNNLLKLFGNTSKISASQSENISIIDKDALKHALKALGILDEAMEIDRFKLQKLVKEHKLSLEQLGETVQKNNSRTLRWWSK